MRIKHGPKALILGAVLILIIAALAFAWFRISASNDEAVRHTTVRYAVPLTIAAAPAYIAEQKGFWTEAGVDVKVSRFNSGREALDALLSNNADFMSVSETPPLRAYIAGQDIKIITTVTEHREAKLTIRTDRISQPSDIKGKKIGTVTGTNSDYYMYRWLEAHGIKTNEVTIVPLAAGSISQAFIQGDIDAMFAWEPLNYSAYSKIPTLATSWPTDLYSGRHTVVMKSSYLDKNTAVAERVIKGFLLAEKFIQTNPDESKSIVAQATGMSKEAVDKLWSEYTFKVQLDDGLKTILNNEANWISSTGKTALSVDPAKIVDPRAMLSVDPGSIGGAF